MKILGFEITRAKTVESTQKSFYGQGENGNWFDLGNLDTGFQRNLTRNRNDTTSTAYACIMANSRACSLGAFTHIQKDVNGRDTVKNSAATRVLDNPNNYETRNHFILNMVASMLFHGESFAYCIRNDRSEIVAMHRLRNHSCSPYIDPETQAIFYAIGDQPLLPGGRVDALIPQRDILHLRAHCPDHPLIGVSPLKYAAMASGINVALSESQLAFYNRASRPSGVLVTDETLNADQVKQLRESWAAQSVQLSKGGVPVLGGGLKWQPLSLSNQDAEIISAMRLSIEEVARTLGTPLPVIGVLENATLSNVEQLISFWLATGLSSLIENLEGSFEKLFGMDGRRDRIEFDESSLLRMDFDSRMSGLVRAIQGGVCTINEAREREGLHAIDGGDTAFLQRQMAPVRELSENPPEPLKPLDSKSILDDLDKELSKLH